MAFGDHHSGTCSTSHRQNVYNIHIERMSILFSTVYGYITDKMCGNNRFKLCHTGFCCVMARNKIECQVDHNTQMTEESVSWWTVCQPVTFNQLTLCTMHWLLTTHIWPILKTRHHSLTFRIRVTTPLQYARNGTAHAAGASSLSLARGVLAGMRSEWHCVRRTVGLVDYRWALPCISSVAIAMQPVLQLQIRPIVHN